MALSEDAKADGLPEEIVAEVENAEQGGQEGTPPEQQTETIRLSRRQAKQQEREAELATLRTKAGEAEALRGELERQREAQARMQGIREQMAGRAAERRPEPVAAPQGREDEPADERVRKQLRKAQEALAKSDLDEYHSRMSKIM